MQICKDWKAKFGVEPRRVMTLADVEVDAELQAALREVRNGSNGRQTTGGYQPSTINHQLLFWLTSYTALGFNGADEWLDASDPATGEKLVSKKLLSQRARDGVIPGVGDVGIGLEKNGIRCVLKPSLATVLQDVFDCVECDEAVRVKATESYQSLGVRRMRPRHAVALTGTPIKNRLEDIFWPLHWCAGSPAEGNARFPFPNNASARERFADLFMVVEENLTRADAYREKNGKGRTFKRRMPRVTNVHALWKLLGGLVMRRRKEDFGEEIVPKTIVPVTVLPGKQQLEVYRHHLRYPPETNAEGEAMDPVAALLAQLNNLRVAALCPDSPSLPTLARSKTDHTPLMEGTLKLIEQRLREGRQVMVASPFTHFSVTLERRLKMAGVSALRLDGETSPEKRGALADEFKQGRHSVLIAGAQAMGEGHSFAQCDTLILPSLHWAYDVNSQVEDRVHRLTSKRPVTIYVLTVRNTIAERLLALYREKSAGASLAIDGRMLAGNEDEEISLGKLLRQAQSDFSESAEAMPEVLIEDRWAELSAGLREAETLYREHHPLAAKTAPAVPTDRDKAIRQLLHSLK